MDGNRSRRRTRARQAIWFVHRWLGLTVGLYLAVVAATGSVLVFKSEIDASQSPPAASSSAAPVARPLAALQGALFRRYGADDARHFTTFQFPSSPGGLYATTGKVAGQSVTLTIDPQGGRIARETTAASPLDGIEDLHVHLLSGAAGFAANGWTALGAAVLLVSGLILYCGSLSSRYPLGARGIGTPAQKNKFATFHALLGVATLLLLLVNTFTGTALVFNDPVERAVYRMTETPPHPGPPLAPTVPTSWIASLDDLLDAARRAAPDASVVFVTLPTRPEQAFYCLLQKPSGVLPYVSVYVHPQTAAILRVDRDDQAPAGRRVMGMIPALHEGTWGGLPVKIVYSAVGCAPLFLYLSGGWLSLRRSLARRQNSALAAQAVQ